MVEPQRVREQSALRVRSVCMQWQHGKEEMDVGGQHAPLSKHVVVGEEDLTFVTAKDTSWSIQGIPVDQKSK